LKEEWHMSILKDEDKGKIGIQWETNYWCLEIYLLLKPELNAKNKMRTIRELAMPAHSCTIGIMNWSREELKKVAMKSR
jgi:hypothetical protein